jgi:hypothetical protein
MPPLTPCAAAYIGEYSCGSHAMKRVMGVAGDPRGTPAPC